MKHTYRITAALTALVMCVGLLSGCGAKDSSSGSGADGSVTSGVTENNAQDTQAADSPAVPEADATDKDADGEYSVRAVSLEGTMENIMYDEFSGTDTKDTRASAPKYTNTTSMSGSSSPEWSGLKAQKKKKMTLMIYVVGSDLESKSSAASMDILEMAGSGLDDENVNVVLCCGGSSGWALPLDSGKLNYLVYNDGDFDVYSSAKKSMGESSTFSGFLKSASKKFPAEHYGVICWDHGSGPVVGYGMDETSPDDSPIGCDVLTVDEITTALSKTQFKKNKLDFIGFDACLMSSVEIAFALEPYADKMIASAETEPGCGWDYSFLKELNGASDLSSIDDAIIKGYAKYISDNRRFDFNPDYVLCSLDLSKTADLEKKVNALFKAMLSDLDSSKGRELIKDRSAVHVYAAASYTDLVDLAHLAQLLEGSHPKESKAVVKALNSFVTNGQTNIKESGGVSIYFPFDNADILSVLGGEDTISAQSAMPDYVEFMSRFLGFIMTGDPSNVYDNIKLSMPAEGKAGDGCATCTLSEEELADFSHAYYTIFSVYDEDQLLCNPILEDIPVSVNSQGVVKLDLDPQIPVINTDLGAKHTGQFKVVQDSGDTVDLVSANSFLSETTDPISDDKETWNVCFNIRGNRETGEAYIKSIDTPVNYQDLVSLSGKQDVSSEGMHCLGFFTVDSHVFQDDLNTPYKQLEGWKWIGHEIKEFDELFSFSFEKLSAVHTGPLSVQLIIVDRSGKEHASDLAVYSLE